MQKRFIMFNWFPFFYLQRGWQLTAYIIQAFSWCRGNVHGELKWLWKQFHWDISRHLAIHNFRITTHLSSPSRTKLRFQVVWVLGEAVKRSSLFADASRRSRWVNSTIWFIKKCVILTLPSVRLRLVREGSVCDSGKRSRWWSNEEIEGRAVTETLIASDSGTEYGKTLHDGIISN